MLGSHLLLALAWVFYFLLHSLLAHMPVKNWFRNIMGSSFKYYRLVYSVIAIVLLLPPIYLLVAIPSLRFWNLTLWTGLPAGILTVVGLWGMIICLKKYVGSTEGFRDLFYEGMKPELQLTGLHRYVRHPLYLSTFICLGGIFLFFPYLSCLISYLLIVLYVIIAIPLEEAKLIGLYGEAYRKYRKEVGTLFPKQVSIKQ
ncbi:MAG TPA: methyltransferase [Chitinophagaceae bacterium]|nr:methyltransferase [Chitinophagaceae bacterium]